MLNKSLQKVYKSINFSQMPIKREFAARNAILFA